MMKLEDILDDAARYLRREMDEEERDFFEELLNQHPHLWEELRFMQLVQQGLTDLQEKQEVKKESNKPPHIFKRKAWGFLISILIIFILSFGGYKYLLENSHPDSPIMYCAQNEVSPITIFGGGLGDFGANRGHSVCAMPSGAIAFVGTFEGTGILGTCPFESKGQRDMLIGLYDIENKHFSWLMPIGGKYPDVPMDIVTDSKGNLIITGSFGGKINFGGRYFRAMGVDDYGERDFFVAKYHPDGQLDWVDHGGGLWHNPNHTGVNSGYALVTDSEDNLIVSGVYIGEPIIAGERLKSGGPNEDIFLVKYDNSGNPKWVETITSNYMVYGYSLGTDDFGNIYIGGSFGHHNFGGWASFSNDTTLYSMGGRDIFLAKYSSEGDFLWVQHAGSKQNKNGYDGVYGLAVDKNGDVVIAGVYYGEATFETKRLNSFGGRDIFLAKYSPDGTLKWLEGMGSAEGSGPKSEQANDIAIDSDGAIYVTGNFTETIYFSDRDSLTTSGNYNFFLAKYSPEGKVSWIVPVETKNDFQKAEGRSIAIARNGNIVVTGSLSGTIRIDNQEIKSQGNGGIFMLVFNKDGNLLSTQPIIALVDKVNYLH